VNADEGNANTLDAYTAFQQGQELLAASSPHAASVALERARRCGRFAAARTEFERAVELDPVNDYAHFGLGKALLRVGDRTRARRHLKLAVAMRPLDDYRHALAEASDPAH